MHPTTRFRISQLLEIPSDTRFFGVATEFNRLIVVLRMSYLHKILLLPLARRLLPMPMPICPLSLVSASS
jgi:hypothetical protein